jgi:hypothetical protein
MARDWDPRNDVYALDGDDICIGGRGNALADNVIDYTGSMRSRLDKPACGRTAIHTSAVRRRKRALNATNGAGLVHPDTPRPPGG